jgi:hypothetical protein
MAADWTHVVTWSLVLGGWWVVHLATLNRDRRKEKRDVSVQVCKNILAMIGGIFPSSFNLIEVWKINQTRCGGHFNKIFFWLYPIVFIYLIPFTILCLLEYVLKKIFERFL